MFRIFIFLLALAGTHCQAQTSYLSELKEQIRQGVYPNIDGILVVQNGTLLIEEYFNGFHRDSLHDTRSSFKSITSLLAGIAIDQSLLSLDDRLSKFFPELTGTEKEEITVRNLLEMKAGLNCEEFFGIGPDCETDMWETDNWVSFCLGVNMKHHPGLNWSYSSIPPMLVGAVISVASQMSIMDFARMYLFKPMEINDYQWTISPEGNGMTAGSFYIRPVDMSKIAQLVYQDGRWNGAQLVSQNWIRQSTDCNNVIDFSFTRYSKMKNAQYESARYGYYWYREKLKYQDINTVILFASGNGGQYMMVLKDYHATVIFTGSNYNNWRGKLPFEILLKSIIPILES